MAKVLYTFENALCQYFHLNMQFCLLPALDEKCVEKLPQDNSNNWGGGGMFKLIYGEQDNENVSSTTLNLLKITRQQGTDS